MIGKAYGSVGSLVLRGALVPLLVCAVVPSLGGDCQDPDTDCSPRRFAVKKKAQTAIVTYPINQDFFELEIHVALLNNANEHLQGPTPPITPQQRPHYCEAVNQWAKRLFVSTEGKYAIGRAYFWSIDKSVVDLDIYESPFRVYWVLGFAANAQFWPSVFVSAKSALTMSDFPFMCTGDKNDADNYVCDANLHSIAGNFTCEELDIVGFGPWGFCKDGADLLEPNASYHGAVLHHEGGHFLFGLPDESSCGAMCLGELDRAAEPVCDGGGGKSAEWPYNGPMNPVAGITGVMGVGAFRHNFCDSTTHVNKVTVGGETILNLDVNYRMNAPGWEILRTFEPGFDNGPVHVDGVYGFLDFDDIGDIVCVFHENVLENDPLMVLDRSGSMNLVLPPDFDYTSLDAAKEAAVHLYNNVPNGIYSGIMAYNQTATVPVDYQPKFGSISVDVALPFDSSGATDIEEAIRTAKERILQAQASQDNVSGAMVLLSDGIPTSPGGLTAQELWLNTLTAAVEACEEGKPPIAIHPLSFGNADEEILLSLALVCNGKLTPNGSNASAMETPLDYKESLTRVGYRLRARDETLHERAPLQATPTSFQFTVPDDSTLMEFTWLSKPLTEVNVGGTPISCAFDTLQFELEDPDGVVTSAAALSPVGAPELDYGARTARVADPLPGTWIARVHATPDCLQVQPELIWIGSVRNSRYIALIQPELEIAPRNTPVLIEAMMIHDDYELSGVSVQLEVLNEGTVTLLAPNDNGLDGDRRAGDGIYSATLGGLAPGEDAGALTIRGVFVSTAGLSAPVPHPADPLLDGPGVDLSGSGLAQPGDALLLAEETLVRQDCCDPDLDPAGCLTFCVTGFNPGATAPKLRRGTLETDVDLEVCGLPLIPGRVQVGFGPDVRATNLRTAYDPVTRCGSLTIDADVGTDATLGTVGGKIESGGRLLAGDNGLALCTADLLPHVDPEDVAIDTCSTGLLEVTLPVPAAELACGGTQGLLLEGWLQTAGGLLPQDLAQAGRKHELPQNNWIVPPSSLAMVSGGPGTLRPLPTAPDGWQANAVIHMISHLKGELHSSPFRYSCPPLRKAHSSIKRRATDTRLARPPR